MKSRDSIIEELHTLREEIGRAHGFDVDRIAATIRQHEAGSGRLVAKSSVKRAKDHPRHPRRRAAQQRDGAVGAS